MYYVGLYKKNAASALISRSQKSSFGSIKEATKTIKEHFRFYPGWEYAKIVKYDNGEEIVVKKIRNPKYQEGTIRRRF